MARKLTSTHKALLKLLPENLSAPELERLLALIEAYFASPTPKSFAVEEGGAAYAKASSGEDVVHFSIPKAWLDDIWFAKLLSWIEMKKLTDGNQMTAEQAGEMGDQSKADWWAKIRIGFWRKLDNVESCC